MNYTNGIKCTAYYRCPDDINNFKVRVKIKELPDATVSERENIRDWETKTISWQEKLFSRFEKELYADEKNCLTDLEKRYHKAVSKLTDQDCLLFTYTSEDGFSPETEVVSSNDISYLQKEIEKIQLRSENGDENEDEMRNSKSNQDGYSFGKSVERSVRQPIYYSEGEEMNIMADIGEYVDNTWIKYQIIICTITYHKKRNLLIVYPDFSSNNPYSIRGENLKNIFFTIENVSEQMPEEMRFAEKELLKKIIQQQSEFKRYMIGDFELPPKNKMAVYLFFEIISGKRFEYDNIFVQYLIDLPDHWSCKTPETTKGMTQTSRTKYGDNLAYFGHVFEVVLEYNIQNFENDRGIPKSPSIYFEVISKDSWDRYRTEGLAYRSLPVSRPGLYSDDIHCFRLCSSNVYSNLRRFFIGDCSNYNDITWIGIPKDHQSTVLNKFGVNTIGTGQLSVRMNILHQSQAFLPEFSDGNFENRKERVIFEKLSASTLVKSVEQVLQAFRRARKNMLDVRKDL